MEIRKMTPKEFRRKRKEAGLTQPELGKILHYEKRNVLHVSVNPPLRTMGINGGVNMRSRGMDIGLLYFFETPKIQVSRRLGILSLAKHYAREGNSALWVLKSGLLNFLILNFLQRLCVSFRQRLRAHAREAVTPAI